jgi:hypothetical protein
VTAGFDCYVSEMLDVPIGEMKKKEIIGISWPFAEVFFAVASDTT